MGIDYAMLSMDGQHYGFKPLEEFTPSEPLRQAAPKDEGDFQDCFYQMTETADKFGFALDLICLISNTGSKMLLGSFEAFQKYGADNVPKH